MLWHVTPILVTTPTSGDLMNKIALEGCPVEGGAPYIEGPDKGGFTDNNKNIKVQLKAIKRVMGRDIVFVSL